MKLRYILLHSFLALIITSVGIGIQNTPTGISILDENHLVIMFIGLGWMGLFIILPLVLVLLGVLINLIDNTVILAVKKLFLGATYAKSNASQIASKGKFELHQIRRRKVEEDIIRAKKLYDMGTLNDDEYDQRVNELKGKL